MTDFAALLQTLSGTNVQFVIVGGLAATAHGSARLTHEALLPHTILLELFGCECRCLDLPWLIRGKRAAGRPRDLESLAELEALLEEQGK